LQMIGSGIIIYFTSFLHIDTTFVLGVVSFICSIVVLIVIYSVTPHSVQQSKNNS
jgi:hypothetical protein